MNPGILFGGSGRYPAFLALFLLLLFSLAACGNDGEAAAARTGRLACTQDCALYGQCGTNQENNVLILGHSSRPETRDHDVTLPDNTAVTILSEQQKTLFFPASELTPEKEETHLFYQVQTADGAVTGWVAAWCVAVNE